MKTVSCQFHKESMQRLEMTIRTQHAFLLLLFVALCYCASIIYQNWSFEKETEAKIEAFKTFNQEELEIWTNERKSFVIAHEWKGKLRRIDAKRVAYYDSKIEELKARNQAINLLEIKLSTP